MDQKIKLLADWVRESGNIVFFGGAGVSRRAGFQISAVRTGSTASNMITRRRRF